jgi:hypothetical protein
MPWTESDLKAVRVFRRGLQDKHGLLRSAAPSDEDLADLIRAQREEARHAGVAQDRADAQMAARRVIATYGIPTEGRGLHDAAFLLGQRMETAEAERDAAREEIARLVVARELVLTERDAAWSDLSAAREKVRGLVEALRETEKRLDILLLRGDLAEEPDATITRGWLDRVRAALAAAGAGKGKG